LPCNIYQQIVALLCSTKPRKGPKKQLIWVYKKRIMAIFITSLPAQVFTSCLLLLQIAMGNLGLNASASASQTSLRWCYYQRDIDKRLIFGWCYHERNCDDYFLMITPKKGVGGMRLQLRTPGG